MAPRSSLLRLPKTVREEVDRLIRDHYTIDEIVAHLRSLGADISRSAVGRYKKNAVETMQRYREAQEIAGVWVRKMGEDPDSDVGRLCLEMLKTQAFQTLSDMGDAEAETAGPKQLALMARSLKDMEAAGKLSLDREERIRKAALEAAAKEVDSVVKKRGLTAEDAAAIRAQILGVGDGRG